MSDKGSLFRKESMDQLSRHIKTGPYVSTSRLMPWLVLVAILIVLISFMIWAFAGNLPVTVSCKGYAKESGSECILFLPPQKMQTHPAEVGDELRVVRPNGSSLLGRVTSVSDTPLSRQEMSDMISNDWIYAEMATSEYNYYITAQVYGHLRKEDIVDAVITVNHVVPFELIYY